MKRYFKRLFIISFVFYFFVLLITDYLRKKTFLMNVFRDGRNISYELIEELKSNYEIDSIAFLKNNGKKVFWGDDFENEFVFSFFKYFLMPPIVIFYGKDYDVVFVKFFLYKKFLLKIFLYSLLFSLFTMIPLSFIFAVLIEKRKADIPYETTTIFNFAMKFQHDIASPMASLKLMTQAFEDYDDNKYIIDQCHKDISVALDTLIQTLEKYQKEYFYSDEY